MTTNQNPGLRHQPKARLFFRVVGGVVLVVGAVLFVRGLTAVFGADDFEGPAGGDVASFIGGLLLAGVGLQLLYLGFMGAAVRYGAGEVAPVARESLDYVTRRTGTDAPAPDRQSGPYCRECGVRNDEEARFCDGCGSALT